MLLTLLIVVVLLVVCVVGVPPLVRVAAEFRARLLGRRD